MRSTAEGPKYRTVVLIFERDDFLSNRFWWITQPRATLETTQGQLDGFFGQLPYKCCLPEVASVGDCLKICPWVASRMEGTTSKGLTPSN